MGRREGGKGGGTKSTNISFISIIRTQYYIYICVPHQNSHLHFYINIVNNYDYYWFCMRLIKWMKKIKTAEKKLTKNPFRRNSVILVRWNFTKWQKLKFLLKCHASVSALTWLRNGFSEYCKDTWSTTIVSNEAILFDKPTLRSLRKWNGTLTRTPL